MCGGFEWIVPGWRRVDGSVLLHLSCWYRRYTGQPAATHVSEDVRIKSLERSLPHPTAVVWFVGAD